MDLDALADAAGIDRALLDAYLNGTDLSLESPADVAGLLALDNALHDVTRQDSSGLRVDYIDAAIFTDDRLAAIKVDTRHPAIRLIFHANDGNQPYVSSTVLAIPGRSALDLVHAEGATAGAVARVVLTKTSPATPP